MLLLLLLHVVSLTLSTAGCAGAAVCCRGAADGAASVTARVWCRVWLCTGDHSVENLDSHLATQESRAALSLLGELNCQQLNCQAWRLLAQQKGPECAAKGLDPEEALRGTPHRGVWDASYLPPPPGPKHHVYSRGVLASEPPPCTRPSSTRCQHCQTVALMGPTEKLLPPILPPPPPSPKAACAEHKPIMPCQQCCK